MPAPYTAREYDGGIIAVDSGMFRREMAACYLLETPGAVALIEVGGNASAPRILDTLRRRGWRSEQVSHLIVTHVHLDHAGGAGSLMQSLPEATLVVHPRGARHLVDPAQLEAGVRAVYGDAVYDAQYGHLVPVPGERVKTMEDGETLCVGQRELVFLDTPGHAKHHFCVWDQQTRAWFTGDTFGISYREFDTARGAFVFPATTPVQFDPDALIHSIERLLQRAPQFMYLTHYGRVGDTRRLADDMIRSIRKLVELAERYALSPTRRRDLESGMLDWLLQSARAHGVDMPQQQMTEFLQMDVIMNTQGIEYWLDHR